MLPTLRRRYWDDSLDAMHREVDRMFRGYVGDEAENLTGSYPVNITEDSDAVHVEAELPGFKRDQINITLEKGVLKIEAERKAEEPNGQTRRHLNERRYTRVARAFSLPAHVDESSVDASLEEGVLSIKLNKREEAKPRRIEVK